MRQVSCRTFLGIVFGFLLTGASPLCAQREIAGENDEPTPHDEWMLGDFGGARSKLDDRGVYLTLDYTADVLGNPVGGKRRGVGVEGAFNLELQIELEYLLGWKGATFTASGSYQHGSNFSPRYVGDLNGTSNLEAYDTARLIELWFEQKVEFGPVALSLRVGSQAVDAEFWLNPHEDALLNNAFGTPLTFSGNFPIPTYALAALGARFAAVVGQPTDHAALLQLGIFDGNPAGGASHDPATGALSARDLNKHGTDWALRRSDGALFAGEIGYTFNQLAEDPPSDADEEGDGKESKKAKTPRGLGGNYRVGALYHTHTFADAYDTALLNEEVTTGRDPARRVSGNSSVYFIVDQELWREPGSDTEGLSFFGRAAFAPRQQNRYDYSWEAGLNYLGLLPGRSMDQLALGFGFTHINPRVSAAARDANRALTRGRQPEAARALDDAHRALIAAEHLPTRVAGARDDLKSAREDFVAAQEDERDARIEDEANRQNRITVPDYEAVVELSYRAQLTRWFALQPDVQWIIHPGGSAAIDNALVIGLRASLSF